MDADPESGQPVRRQRRLRQGLRPGGDLCLQSCRLLHGPVSPQPGIYGFQPASGCLHWLPRLAERGYHCVSIGKTHLPPTGFHEHLAEHDNKCALKIRGQDCDWIRAVRAAGYEPPFDLHDTDPDFYDNLAAIVWPLPEGLHPDIYMADRALEWLDTWDGRAPLYLHLGFLSPHDLYDPPQRFLDLYDDDDIPMPQVTAEERAGIPDELFAQHRRLEAAHGATVIKPSRATPERIRRMRKHYYASVTMIDEKIGQLVDKLKEKGLYDAAVVIFTSDHGDHLFDHDLIYKGELYDTIVRVPLMVKAPGVTPQFRREDLVSHMDVVQYILDMAGADGEGLHGVSLRTAVEEGSEHPNRYVFAEEVPGPGLVSWSPPSPCRTGEGSGSVESSAGRNRPGSEPAGHKEGPAVVVSSCS